MNLDPRKTENPSDRKVFLLAGITTAIIVMIWFILTQTALRGVSVQPEFTWKESFNALGKDIHKAIDENPIPERSPILSEITNSLEGETEQEYGTETREQQ